MATNNDDDELDRWLEGLPADTRAAILDSVEGEGKDEDVDESPPIEHPQPALDEEPEPDPQPEEDFED